MPVGRSPQNPIGLHLGGKMNQEGGTCTVTHSCLAPLNLDIRLPLNPLKGVDQARRVRDNARSVCRVWLQKAEGYVMCGRSNQTFRRQSWTSQPEINLRYEPTHLVCSDIIWYYGDNIDESMTRQYSVLQYASV